MIPDRCPGVLRPHQAADGAVIRVRVPGGQTTAAALAALSSVGIRYGSGLIQLTSRGSIQLRGLPAVLPGNLVDEVRAAGFLPSDDHERVRNIVASPLTGLTGGVADLRPMIIDLDRAIIADPDLAGLSGRFLFGLDDGRGDVSGLALDIAYQARDPDGGAITASGRREAVAADRAVVTMIDFARRLRREPVSPGPPGGDRPVELGDLGGHASVAVPLGLLTPAQLAAVLAVSGGGAVVITPWRGLILPRAGHRLADLAAAGLVVDTGSPWTRLSACVGAPYCRSGRIETLPLADRLARAATTLPRTHLSGCERRCGAPNHDHLDLVAPSEAEAFARTRQPAHA